MTVTLGTLQIVDGNGTPQSIQVLDQSGAGSGPFTWGHVIIDGLAGTLRAQVTSGNALKVDGSAVTQPVLQKRSVSGVQTNVPSTTSSVSLLTVNAGRLGATVYNDSSAVLYVLLGTSIASTASTSVYTVQLASQSYYEVPFNFTGPISGLWASANGTARLTELN